MPRVRAQKPKPFVDTAKKKAAKGSKQHKRQSSGIELIEIKPKKYPQEQVMQLFYENNLLLHGPAGTGKTFIPLYMALREVLEESRSPYSKIIIIRSAVASRDIGFLKGTDREKIAVYERPYREAVNELCARGDAYDLLTQKGLIEFESTSFLRGCTLNDAIIVVDEAQNCSEHELDTIATRLGRNAKLIFCGDYVQSDLKGKEKEGFLFFISVLKKMQKIECIEFGYQDIVRSDFVKEYIIARDELRGKI